MHPYRAWPFLSDPHHAVLSAAWAVLVHGTLSLLVLGPILLGANRRLLLGALAFIGGAAVDLDHAVAAASVSPRALEHLGQRPATHSLGLAVAATLATLAVTRNRTVAWSVFAVIAAHLLFDAAGGSEQWLFPLEQPDAIAWLWCPAGLAVLTLISGVLAARRRRARQVPQQPRDPLPAPQAS